LASRRTTKPKPKTRPTKTVDKTYIYEVHVLVTTGRVRQERETVKHDSLEKAYKFAAGWLKGHYGEAEAGWKVSVSIIPVEKASNDRRRIPTFQG
jgi:hypothetical protein